MKRIVMTVALLISLPGFIQAQTGSEENDTTKRKLNFSLDFSQTSDSIQYVLFVLKSQDQYEEVLISRNRDISTIIDSKDIESIEVLKGESAIKAYGTKAKYGAVVLHFEHGKFKRLKKDLNDRLLDNK